MPGFHLRVDEGSLSRKALTTAPASEGQRPYLVVAELRAAVGDRLRWSRRAARQCFARLGGLDDFRTRCGGGAPANSTVNAEDLEPAFA